MKFVTLLRVPEGGLLSPLPAVIAHTAAVDTARTRRVSNKSQRNIDVSPVHMRRLCLNVEWQ